MTRQLDELRLWISSLQPRQSLFENHPEEPGMACLDQFATEDHQP